MTCGFPIRHYFQVQLFEKMNSLITFYLISPPYNAAHNNNNNNKTGQLELSTSLTD
jgi:hypothetical protein